jgi:hypothetical protein
MSKNRKKRQQRTWYIEAVVVGNDRGIAGLRAKEERGMK